MRQRSVSELLQDVLRFGQMAREFAGGDADSYLEDRLSQRAVERCLQIAGEAVTQLVSLDAETAYRISEVQRIMAFRHLLTHHYYRVTQQLVWEIVQTSLPQLEQEAAHALADLRKNEGER